MTISSEMVKSAGFRSGMAKAGYVPEDVVMDKKINRMETHGYRSEKDRLSGRGMRGGALGGALVGAAIGTAGIGTGYGKHVMLGSTALGAGIGALLGHSSGKYEAKQRRRLMEHLATLPKEKRQSVLRSAVDDHHRRQTLDAQNAQASGTWANALR